jgi:signal recognition particle subunit SRP19
MSKRFASRKAQMCYLTGWLHILAMPAEQKDTYHKCSPIQNMPGSKDKITIWPLYFDSAKTRSEGRMVRMADSVADPTLDDVIAAALKVGLNPEIEREKKHPSMWHESSGRILVPKSEPKTAMLKKIGKSLKDKKRS